MDLTEGDWTKFEEAKRLPAVMAQKILLIKTKQAYIKWEIDKQTKED